MRDIGDVRIVLEDVGQASPSREADMRSAGARRCRWLALGSGLLALVAVAVVLWSQPRGADAPAMRATRWSLELPEGGELGWRGTSASLSKLGRGSPFLAGSADGSRMASIAGGIRFHRQSASAR